MTQTVSGCTSPAGSGVAAPRTNATLSSNLAMTVNSGVAFTYTPTSATTGTTFSWSRAAVTGISNAATTGTGNISEALINTTTAAINVTYVYTLTVNGCTSTQNLVVTVNAPSTGVNCRINGSITSSFTSTTIPAGRYIWFNSVFDRGTISGTAPVTFTITNSVITFTANSQQYALQVPNATITFDALVLIASTEFINNTWVTKVPRTFNSYAFMTGLSYLVPANLPGGISNINWSADISINQTGVGLTWRWAAAVYTTFAANAGLAIKPINGLTLNPYLNSDRAGTPENFKASVVSGAKGSGGTNYTGNYSSTATATCSTVGTRPVTDALFTSKNGVGGLEDLTIESIGQAKLDATVIPNPSSTYFTITVRGKHDSPLTLRIIDIFGQVVERHERIAANTTLRLGQSWTSGAYFAELTQGDQRRMVKIVIAK